jgi:hypothetical protein
MVKKKTTIEGINSPSNKNPEMIDTIKETRTQKSFGGSRLVSGFLLEK